MNDLKEPKPIFVTIRQGCSAINVGPTKMYELINDEKLETVMIGRRRLIVYASLEALAANIRETGSDHNVSADNGKAGTSDGGAPTGKKEQPKRRGRVGGAVQKISQGVNTKKHGGGHAASA